MKGTTDEKLRHRILTHSQDQWMPHSDSEEEEQEFVEFNIEKRTGIDKLINDIVGLVLALFAVSFQVPIYFLMFTHHLSCWIFDLFFPLFGEFENKTKKQIFIDVSVSIFTLFLMILIPILFFNEHLLIIFLFYFVVLSWSYLLEFSSSFLERLIDEERWVKVSFSILLLISFHSLVWIPFHFLKKNFSNI
eukprot:gene9552-1756_t